MMRRVMAALVVLVAVAGCGDDDADPSAAPVVTEATTTPDTIAAPTTTVVASTTPATAAADPTTTIAVTEEPATGIVNTWVEPPVDLTRLPLGTAFVSTEAPAVGGLFACTAGNPAGGGAFRAGPWIDEAAGTWDATAKVSVEGAVEWPMARYSETVEGETRSIASSGLPVGHVTGTFPIAATDPAYQYDRNPNAISETDVNFQLPVSPVAAATPGCLPPGVVAIARGGVVRPARRTEP